MTLQSAIVIILCAAAVMLYVQTRADRARRGMERLSLLRQWTDLALENARRLAQTEDFPASELDNIYRFVDLFDKKSAAHSLYMLFEREQSKPETMTAELQEYFDRHPQASEEFVELVLNGMMAISYLDNYGYLVRPSIEKLRHRAKGSPVELIKTMHHVGREGVDALPAAA